MALGGESQPYRVLVRGFFVVRCSEKVLLVRVGGLLLRGFLHVSEKRFGGLHYLVRVDGRALRLHGNLFRRRHCGKLAARRSRGLSRAVMF